MKIYVAVGRGQVTGVYATRREAKERGQVEEFELDIKFCPCGAPMSWRTVVLTRNGRLWETDEWECVPCNTHQTNWGDVKPILG